MIDPKKMNLPQQNRVFLILELARTINNMTDDLSIAEAIRALEKEDRTAEALELITELETAIYYRVPDWTTFKVRISEAKQEIRAYDSLEAAIRLKCESAQMYFDRMAKVGEPIRIM